MARLFYALQYTAENQKFAPKGFGTGSAIALLCSVVLETVTGLGCRTGQLCPAVMLI